MNPRAATNDLLPFQGSPFGQLGYFSKMPGLKNPVILYIILYIIDSLSVIDSGY